MGHLALLLASLAAAGALPRPASAHYMNGHVDRVNFHNGGTTCTFSVDKVLSPSEVFNAQVCKFLRRARRGGTPVSVSAEPLLNIPALYTYTVSFLNRNAVWAGDKLASDPSTYRLTGTVENVYYGKDSCFVAVDAGAARGERYSRVYHVTADYSACERAACALQRGATVTLAATLDRTPGYSNNIDALTAPQCD